MRTSWRGTQRRPAFSARCRARVRVEELETRNLLSVFSPIQIRQAYGFGALSSATNGAGTTIAIVDAYADPTIAADLANFNQQWGLPAANLTVVDKSGGQADPTGGWQLETALDVEWAHAIAPGANLLLVQAASDTLDASGAPADLLTAVDTAAGTPGVDVVSMSWGLGEWAGEVNSDFHFSKPGVTFVAASGDSGAPPIWPATSPNVLAVGGTTLRLSGSSYSSEKGWGSGYWSPYFGGSGGGISPFESKPTYQSAVKQSKTQRTSPDVAYNADPNTGYYVYDTTNGGWFSVGGTSAGSPQWAGLVALGDQGRSSPLSSAQTLSTLYSLPTTDFHDVTTGNNGYAAAAGYDLVTGLGSPKADKIVPALKASTAQAVTKAATTTSTTSSRSVPSSTTRTPPVIAGADLLAVTNLGVPTSQVLSRSFTTSSPVTTTPVAPVVSTVSFAPVFATQAASTASNSGGGGDVVAPDDQPADLPKIVLPGIVVPAAAPVAPAAPEAKPAGGPEVQRAVDQLFIADQSEAPALADRVGDALAAAVPESDSALAPAMALAGLLVAMGSSRGWLPREVERRNRYPRM